jgi:lipoyl(octanoyl) transferase
MEIPRIYLGEVHYQTALNRQIDTINHWKRTKSRTQIYSFEPLPIVTLGLRSHHLKSNSDCETLKVDRGGEATYHGPGQILFFPVVHLPTWNFGVSDWVTFLLKISVSTLERLHIPSTYDLKRPGLFTVQGKIASVGLRIRNGWSSHGLALNVNGSLEPFSSISTCGMRDAAIDQVSHWQSSADIKQVSALWQDEYDKAWKDHLRLGLNVDRAALFSENQILH